MKIPFLDLKAQYASIKNEVLPVINKVLDNTAYVLGESVFEFEKTFAEKHNVKYCIATSSGTDANHLALWALDIGPGDEVIMPANTFIATAWGATLCGATPVFVDCEKDSYNIDPNGVEKAITSKTKAIVAVHLYGQPADMDPLTEIGKKHGIPVVEDAAQAHIAEYKEKKVGGLGLATSFSFYPGKNLGAYGEGGAVLTNDQDLALKIKSMRDHGAQEKYNHEIYGHNYRMEGIQGAVLNVKMKYIDSWTDDRRRVAEIYNSELSNYDKIKIPSQMNYSKHVYHLYVVQVDGKRNKLREYLAEKDIATGLHYPIPLHLQKCFQPLNYKEGSFPVSENLASTGISLPMYPELTDDMVKYVCDSLLSFYY